MRSLINAYGSVETTVDRTGQIDLVDTLRLRATSLLRLRLHAQRTPARSVCHAGMKPLGMPAFGHAVPASAIKRATAAGSSASWRPEQPSRLPGSACRT